MMGDREVQSRPTEGSTTPSSTHHSSVPVAGSSPISSTPSDSRADSKTDSKTDSKADSRPDLNKCDPLPPIGTDWAGERLTQSTCQSSVKSSLRTPSGGSLADRGRPRIVSYRRETDHMTDHVTDRVTDHVTDRVSPEYSESEPTTSGQTSSMGTATPAVRVVSTVTAPDGREHIVISVDSQTEWSWLTDMAAAAAARRRVTLRSRKSQTRSAGQVSIISTLTSGHKSSQASTLASSLPADTRDRAFSALNATPHPSRADEYGIPLIYLSSESDASGDEGEGRKDGGPTAAVNILPSVGPPQILQYQSESKHTLQLSHDAKRSHDHGAQPDLLQMFAGNICEFCQRDVKPMPSLDQQKSEPLESLFCCESYREMMMMLMNPAAMIDADANKLIDIKPGTPIRSKLAQKLAKEKAAQRMREREFNRQQAAMMAAGHGGQASSGAASFYQFARQMNTINYMLSSQWCLDQGWTLRPPSPLFAEELPPDIFEPEKMFPPRTGTSAKDAKLEVVMKYYENGNVFLVLFSDGTGNVFYRSGGVAITITSTEGGIYSYIVQGEERGNMMAVCETNGYVTVYYDNGDIRLCLDQLGGVELDRDGGRRKRWSWHQHDGEHVHAPPIQPITMAVDGRHVALRVNSQQSVTLTFSAGSRACRFQVGARLKLVAPEYLPKTTEFDEYDICRREITLKVASLFDKVVNLLKFPNSPKLLQLPSPSHLTSRAEKLQRDKGAGKGKGKKDAVTVT